LFVLFAGLGYKNETVNHSQEYVTAEGVHSPYKPYRKSVA